MRDPASSPRRCPRRRSSSPPFVPLSPMDDAASKLSRACNAAATTPGTRLQPARSQPARQPASQPARNKPASKQQPLSSLSSLSSLLSLLSLVPHTMTIRPSSFKSEISRSQSVMKTLSQSEFNTPRSENNTNFSTNAQRTAATRGGRSCALPLSVSFPYCTPNESNPPSDGVTGCVGSLGRHV